MVLDSQISIGELFGLATNSVILLSISTGILLLLGSADVIHAIAAPGFGLKLDAIPGRVSLQKVTFDISGTIFGQCSELCGAMHGFMPIGFVGL